MSDPAITCYTVDGDRNPSGFVRRIHITPVSTCEAFGRNMQWHRTEYLRRYWLGHNDVAIMKKSPPTRVNSSMMLSIFNVRPSAVVSNWKSIAQIRLGRIGHIAPTAVPMPASRFFLGR